MVSKKKLTCLLLYLGKTSLDLSTRIRETAEVISPYLRDSF